VSRIMIGLLGGVGVLKQDVCQPVNY